MIRLLLIDDHTSFRGALAFMLGREEDIQVVGEAGTVAEARAVLERAPVDVALVDLNLGGEDGTTLVQAIHTHYPTATAIVLTANPHAESRARAIAAGAAGVILKTASIPEVLAAVRIAAAGEALVQPAGIGERFRDASSHQPGTTGVEPSSADLPDRR